MVPITLATLAMAPNVDADSWDSTWAQFLAWCALPVGVMSDNPLRIGRNRAVAGERSCELIRSTPAKSDRRRRIEISCVRGGTGATERIQLWIDGDLLEWRPKADGGRARKYLRCPAIN
jgi:hypothetical protein